MSEPCVKSDKIKRLETDVSSINERLNRHSDKIDRISDNNLVLETILKRLEEDSISQKQTNAETQKTMVAIQGAMVEITFNIRELNTKLKSTDDKVDSVTTKVSDINSKHKWDWVLFIRDKAIPALIVGGLGYYLSQLTK